MTTETGTETGQPPAGVDDLRLSVVMPNYNYGQFIGSAVQSALDVEGTAVEVIVVDDGSTDDSLEVLGRFGDRIQVISQENAGPRVACNVGFAASSGNVVIFLDSDDQLEPSIGAELAAVWRPGISKVQVQMQRIDAEGAPSGGVFPRLQPTPSPSLVRDWMTSTGAYPTPPGSGNAYTRSFLDQLLPLDDSCGDATDSACLAAAPYLGDVVTIARPLVRYRVHGANRSLLNEPARFTRQVERAFQRHQFALRVASRPSDVDSVVRVLRRGRHLLQMRIAERRLNGGEPPLPQDSATRQVVDSLRAITAPGPESPVERLSILLWCLATSLAPQRAAEALITWRFGPRRRSA